MTTIYIVVGSTGEYSDHTEWYVKAFRSKVKAEQFVLDVSAEYRRLCPDDESTYDFMQMVAYEDPHRPENKLDPNMKVDYTGVNYNVYAVPFDEEDAP